MIETLSPVANPGNMWTDLLEQLIADELKWAIKACASWARQGSKLESTHSCCAAANTRKAQQPPLSVMEGTKYMKFPTIGMHFNPRRAIKGISIMLGCAYSLYTVAGIVAFPAESRVQFVPDDSYYYMTLARNFASLGTWSFDSGVSLTSGFHLLHAYALSFAYWLAKPMLESFVGIAVGMSYVAAIPALLFGVVFAVRRKNLLPSLLLLLLLLSRNVNLNLISGAEWGWVVSTSALYCLLYGCRSNLKAASSHMMIFACGFVGSTARTDFVLLPLSLLAASLFWTGSRSRLGVVRYALNGLLGSISGVLFVLLHNQIATGQALQSSARMKSLWGQVYGPSALPIVRQALTLFAEPALEAFALLVVILLFSTMIGFHRYGKQMQVRARGKQEGPSAGQVAEESREGGLWLGCLLALIAYLVFYSMSSVGVQPWYTSGLIVPIYLTISLPASRLHWRHPFHMVTIVVLLVLLGLQVIPAARFLERPQWPHQTNMYEAGQFLRTAGLVGRVGSWNAGIIGYYEGGRVVNLDGLVNNDIYPYAARNELSRYIDQESIAYIVDFENMFTSEPRRKRGGYNDADFINRLQPVRQFDDEISGWRKLTLYTVLPMETWSSAFQN